MLILSEGNAYFQIQGTRPQTIASGLTDSPVGQLAWIVEKFEEWTHPSVELPEKAIDRDRMLTNVMLYWLTAAGVSSAQLNYESMHASNWPRPSTVATGVAVFAEDSRSGASQSRPTTSCTGRSSSVAVTSPLWRHPNSLSAASASYCVACADAQGRSGSGDVLGPRALNRAA